MSGFGRRTLKGPDASGTSLVSISRLAARQATPDTPTKSIVATPPPRNARLATPPSCLPSQAPPALSLTLLYKFQTERRRFPYSTTWRPPPHPARERRATARWTIRTTFPSWGSTANWTTATRSTSFLSSAKAAERPFAKNTAPRTLTNARTLVLGRDGGARPRWPSRASAPARNCDTAWPQSRATRPRALPRLARAGTRVSTARHAGGTIATPTG